MTFLITAYVLFLIGGIAWLHATQTNRKERAFFIVITTLGAVLWGSILIRHPLDVNRAIVWLLSQ